MLLYGLLIEVDQLALCHSSPPEGTDPLHPEIYPRSIMTNWQRAWLTIRWAALAAVLDLGLVTAARVSLWWQANPLGNVFDTILGTSAGRPIPDWAEAFTSLGIWNIAPFLVCLFLGAYGWHSQPEK